MTGSFQQRRTRVGALTIAIAALFAVAALRLVMLVSFDGAKLNSLGRSEHTAETELAAVRGLITDRDGQPMALSVETQSVYARPRHVLDASTPAERAKLASTLGITPRDLEEKLSKSAPFVWLARRLAPERAQAAESLGIDGIGALGEYKRFYPESNLAAAVVGLAGMDGQGLSGLEQEYDRLIRGEPVELQFYHDAMGHPIFDSPMALKAPEPGAHLELTIDSSIQSLAETELAQEVHQSGARRGSAIVLDPFTGEVIAMANVGADPDSVHDRLHNAAVQDAFEPGSTMKGILGAIALANGTITPTQQIYCEDGHYTIDRRTIHDDSRHGWLDLGGIIEVSSNIGAAKIAMSLGSDRFYDGLRAFGIGSRTGIDLPGEAGGLLNRASGWRTIDLANHGFGQGVAVTPIQLAVAYSAIANGGMIVRPYVVKAAYDADGTPILTHTPSALRRAIPTEVAHQMNLLLRNVVNGADGTGRRAQVDGFTVAGKTGTAQMVNPQNGTYFQNRHVSSFVGFLPADDPRLLILVVLYDVGHGHFGGLVAAPVFSEIAEGAARDLNIVPADQSYRTASMIPLPAPGTAVGADDGIAVDDDSYTPVLTGSKLMPATPGFVGLSLRRALELARLSHVQIEVHGTGYVAIQEPPAGAPMSHSAVKLTLAPAVQEDADSGIVRASYPISGTGDRPGSHK
ncbi:MAG TPA: penicillin-binding transpeptidase domain-containing protein [Candidatus Binataceae bacterium]|nr:penicillin-binding transpeptidase domain-containing protein [Candidatus Binataceae bacterium]